MPDRSRGSAGHDSGDAWLRIARGSARRAARRHRSARRCTGACFHARYRAAGFPGRARYQSVVRSARTERGGGSRCADVAAVAGRTPRRAGSNDPHVRMSPSRSQGGSDWLMELRPEVEALAHELRRFLENEVEPSSGKIDQEDAIPPDIVAKARELGLFGLTIPEQFGGTG